MRFPNSCSSALCGDRLNEEAARAVTLDYVAHSDREKLLFHIPQSVLIQSSTEKSKEGKALLVVGVWEQGKDSIGSVLRVCTHDFSTPHPHVHTEEGRGSKQVGGVAQ